MGPHTGSALVKSLRLFSVALVRPLEGYDRLHTLLQMQVTDAPAQLGIQPLRFTLGSLVKPVEGFRPPAGPHYRSDRHGAGRSASVDEVDTVFPLKPP